MAKATSSSTHTKKTKTTSARIPLETKNVDLQQQDHSVPLAQIPNPIPENTVVHSPSTHSTTSKPKPTTITTSTPTTTPEPNSTLSFSYPTLQSTTSASSIPSMIVVHSNPVQAVPQPVSTHHTQPAHQPPQQQQQLSTTIIALLAVGCAFFLLGIFIILRACFCLPRKRVHPTPSKPILDSSMTDDSHIFADDIESSPLFGGKERFSARPVSDSTWNYTGPQQLHFNSESTVIEPGMIMHGRAATGVLLQPQPAPFNQIRSALTRAVSRLSTASTSLYPSSPTNVGIAISASSPYAAYDQSLRPAKDRESRYLAYDGADVSSPIPPHSHYNIPSIVTSMPEAGRTRIKSTHYTPGAYSRASTYSKAETNNYSIYDPPPPPLPPSMLHKSPSHRARETEKLAAALGLPAMPSSPQSLYPDDSISVKIKPSTSSRRMHLKKPVPSVPSSANVSTLSPSLDTSGALAMGNLMLSEIDFGTMASIATVPSTAKLTSKVSSSASQRSMIPRATSLKKVGSSSNIRILKNDDRPPRVPSPPPLPSLSQMNLFHEDEEKGAGYYSIYGLYETKRKSMAA